LLCHQLLVCYLIVSAGGNLGFETAAFKLSHEMIDLMDGKDSELFRAFKHTTIRAFMTARTHGANSLQTLVASYADSGLPSFNLKLKKDTCLMKLRKR
jgi:phosphatidylinositol 4-kinase